MSIHSRQHPEVTDQLETWEKSRDAYAGGRSYINTTLIQHVSETVTVFNERKQRAYYFNYPRAIAERITQYALSVDPTRENARDDIVEDFDRSGLRIGEVMRRISTMLNVYGRVWAYVGSPSFDAAIDAAAAQQAKIRPFGQAVSPICVKDWSFGQDGRLLWLLHEIDAIADSDPMVDRVKETRRILWTREKWQIFNRSGESLATGPNEIKEVPFVEIIETNGYGLGANHWFEDVVRISNAMMNAESEAQMNIVKQMFGQLVISESFSRSTEKVRDKDGNTEKQASVISRSSAIVEDKDEKGISRYISPSGVETATIRAEIANLKQELYDVVGLAIQSRSKEAQTAESKAWDFNNVSQFLASRADMLEQAELAMWRLMNKWDSSIPIPKVTYNRKFAIRDLAGSINGLLQLSNVPGTGIEYQKQIARAALEMIDSIASISDEDRNKLIVEINAMQPAPVPEFDYPVDNQNPDRNNQ